MARRSPSIDSCSEGGGEDTESLFDFDTDHHSPLLPLSHKDHYDWDLTTPTPNARKIGSQAQSTSKFRRQHKLAYLVKLATWFIVSCWLIIGMSAVGWAGWLFWTRHEAFSRSIFAHSLQPDPIPVEHLVAPFPSPTSSVQSELDQRLASLGLPPSTLPTPSLSSLSHFDLDSTFASRYSSLPSSGPFLIALNLYNSQYVLPTLSKTLLSVSEFLGPQNVHISIFENGSRDNTTLALAHLAAALTSLDVEHTIVSDSRSTDWKRVDRIDQLAIYRNVALAPVTKGLNGKDFEDVLFINDVYVGPTDVLELLWQRREQESDAACAMDWRETKGIFSKLGRNSIKMYDSWVSLFLSQLFLISKKSLTFVFIRL